SLVALHLGLSPLPIPAPTFVDFDAAGGEVCGITPTGEAQCLEGPFDLPGPADALLLRDEGRCALAEGALRCEGTGPLDVDLSPWSFGPAAPFPLAVSPRHGCARTSAGEALCWGNNESGQVEDPPDEEDVWLEPRVVAEGIRSLAVAEGATFLLSAEGRLSVHGGGRILFQWFNAEVAACLDDGLRSFARQGEIHAVYTGPGNHRC